MISMRLCRINALLVIIGAAGLIVAATGSLLVSVNLLEPAEAVPFRWFQGALTDLNALTGAHRTAAYVGTALALFFGGVLAIGNLLFLLRGRDDPAGRSWIRAQVGRSLIVPRHPLEMALVQAAQAVDGVIDATVSVHESTDGLIDARVRLSLDLPVGRDALPTIDEVEARMARVAREDFGVVIARVDIASTPIEPRRLHA